MKRLPLEPRAAGALVGVVLSFLLLLSIVSYGEAEFASAEPLHWYQSFGSLFVGPLGLGAYVLALSPLLWSLIVYFREEVPDLVTRGVGTLLFATSVALLVGVLQGGQESFWAGHLGTAAAAWFETLGLWKIVFWVATVVLFVVSLMLATDFLFYNVRNPRHFEPASRLVTINATADAELAVDGETSGEREHVVQRREATALELDVQADDEIAVATPEGWSRRQESGRDVLRGPVGYEGVEFLSSDDELATPEPPLREEVLYTGFDGDEYDLIEPAYENEANHQDAEQEPDAVAEETPEPAAETPEEEADDALVESAEETEEPAAGGIGYADPEFMRDEVVAFSPAMYGVIGFEDAPVAEQPEPVATPAPEQAAPDDDAAADADELPESVRERSTPRYETVATERTTPREGLFDDVVIADLPLFDDVLVPAAAAADPTEIAPSAPTSAPAEVVTGDDDRLALSRALDRDLDPLFHDAVDAVLARGRASAVVLQRELGVGYARGLRLLDQMTECGIAGEDTPTGARALLVSESDWLAATSGVTPSA